MLTVSLWTNPSFQNPQPRARAWSPSYPSPWKTWPWKLPPSPDPSQPRWLRDPRQQPSGRFPRPIARIRPSGPRRRRRSRAQTALFRLTTQRSQPPEMRKSSFKGPVLSENEKEMSELWKWKEENAYSVLGFLKFLFSCVVFVSGSRVVSKIANPSIDCTNNRSIKLP